MQNFMSMLRRADGYGNTRLLVLSLSMRTMLTSVSTTVTEVLPRLKEGGAFVKFTYEAETSAKDVEKQIKAYLKENQIKPWWNPLQRMRANLVRGKPWVEDLYRLPSSRLKVEFLPTAPGAEAAEMSQEQLFSFFRQYGKLADIVPQPPDSKILPKFAYLDYFSVKPA
ncbi:mitochondrial escape protein 2, partial [Cryomyces antarcticus]